MKAVFLKLHLKHLNDLLNDVGPHTFQFSRSGVGPRIGTFNKFTGDIDAADPETIF